VTDHQRKPFNQSRCNE